MEAKVSEHAAEVADALQRRLIIDERELDWHKVLLQWIEQERQIMVTEYPTPVEKDHHDRDPTSKAVKRASTCDRQTRRAKPSAVLGKVRIMKAKPKKQTQKSKAQESTPTIQDSNVIPQSSTSLISKRQERKPLRTKDETPPGQFYPQRVSKAKSGTHRRGAGQTRSSDRVRSLLQQPSPRPHSALGNTWTRCGRISRQPARWTPG